MAGVRMSSWKRALLGLGVAGVSASVAVIGFAMFREHCPFDKPCEPTSVFEVADFRLLYFNRQAMVPGTDGSVILLGSDRTSSGSGQGPVSARLFDPETGNTQELYELPMQFPGKASLISPDGKQIALFCYGTDQPARCVDNRATGLLANLADGAVLEEFEGPMRSAADLFDLPENFTDQSRVIPDSGLFVHALRPSGDVVLFSLEDGSEQQRFSLTEVSELPGYVGVQPSPDGTKLAVQVYQSSGGGHLIVMDRADGRALATFGLPLGIEKISWTDSNLRLLTARGLSRTGEDSNTEIRVFDLPQ